jgi:hypothetical protein
VSNLFLGHPPQSALKDADRHPRPSQISETGQRDTWPQCELDAYVLLAAQYHSSWHWLCWSGPHSIISRLDSGFFSSCRCVAPLASSLFHNHAVLKLLMMAIYGLEATSHGFVAMYVQPPSLSACICGFGLATAEHGRLCSQINALLRIFGNP